MSKQIFYNVIIGDCQDHKPWRSIYSSIFSTSEKALQYVKIFFKENFEEIENQEELEEPIKLTLENYNDFDYSPYFVNIETKFLDSALEEEEKEEVNEEEENKN